MSPGNPRQVLFKLGKSCFLFTLFRVVFKTSSINEIVMPKFSIFLILILILGQGLGASNTKKKKDQGKKSGLEEVTGDALKDILDDNDEVLVLFYEDDKTPTSKKLVTNLEKLDLTGKVVWHHSFSCRAVYEVT